METRNHNNPDTWIIATRSDCYTASQIEKFKGTVDELKRYLYSKIKRIIESEEYGPVDFGTTDPDDVEMLSENVYNAKVVFEDANMSCTAYRESSIPVTANPHSAKDGS